MPKKQIIHKQELRIKETLISAPIAMNAYQSNFKAEHDRYGQVGLINVYYDMLLIREFEQMLDAIKTQEEYKGIKYKHLGPAHLSIGQESAAVGQALELDKEDFIFGSHRSHGEILAKCFSAIRKINAKDLLNLMEQYRGGNILKVINKHLKTTNEFELAEYFILYGLLAEIFARENGFNAGLGGSMHAFFVPLGSMPNNAIVGGSADIALGSALYKKINRKPGIVIANIGDAAMACGPVWEALVFATMAQYNTLWDQNKGAPPYLLNVFNNFYGMGGQTRGETMGMGATVRIASGLNEHSMHAERIDGFNPLAVADAIKRKKELLLSGKGPVLLDTITYRTAGHSPSDASTYRTKEEIDEFRLNSPIDEYKEYLQKNKVLAETQSNKLQEQVIDKITSVLILVANTDISPFVEPHTIERYMFSRGGSARKPSVQTATNKQVQSPETILSLQENPRVMQLANKKRYSIDEQGNPYSAMQLYTLRDAIFEAVLHAAYTDSTLVIYGEENRDWGGAFACYRGLTESLPYHRLFNPPIAEAAIVGTAIGYALSGGRALVELMYCDFLGRAGDEVFNQMPKWQSMSATVLHMPMVLRVSVGNKYGAQHSQDWTSLVAHMPGLQVMYPATPYDAKGMLNMALTGSDPVVFFESQKLYGVGEQFHTTGVPKEYYEIELGQPIVRRKGKDLTIITLGPPLYPALNVCERLSKEFSIDAELIDLRFVNPLNYDLLLESVKKTGKVLLVSDAVERGCFLHTVASTITASAFDYLDAPPIVLGSKNWITPPAELELAYFPTEQSMLDTIDQNLIVLKNFVSKSTQTQAERIRANKLGV